jgi:hypothetical protein
MKKTLLFSILSISIFLFSCAKPVNPPPENVYVSISKTPYSESNKVLNKDLNAFRQKELLKLQNFAKDYFYNEQTEIYEINGGSEETIDNLLKSLTD